MKKLGIAIIGTGGISHFHLEGYLEEKDRCTVVALCDLYEDKCLTLANDYKLDLSLITITKNYKTLLSRNDIDVVSICLPPTLHCEVTSAFLLAGKDVLCEKPMAASLEEADVMLQAEKKSGKILGIISQNRFRESAWKVKKMLDQGVFGKVLMSRANSMWYRGNSYYDLWWRGTWNHEGGGCTLNHSVHQIDMLNWFMGMPTSTISIMTNLTHTNSEVEDTSLSILRYPQGVGEINVSLNDMNEKQDIFFQCEKAEVSVPWEIHCMKSKNNGFPIADLESEKKFQEIYDSLDGVDGKEGHPAEIRNFLNAVQGKDTLVVTSIDGKNALELIYAIYKSSSEKREVLIPLDKNDVFYKKETMFKVVPRFFEKTKSIENADGNITVGNMDEDK